MGRKKQKRLGKIRNFLVLATVLAVFILPVAATAMWVNGLLFDSDSDTIKVDEFNVRPADSGKTSLSPFSEPIISVTFDDGWESAYSTGLPIMHKYGIKSTQYILADQFQDLAYMSEAQVHSAIEMGHEVSSHSLTHPDLTQLSDTELLHEIRVSKEKLAEKFPIKNDFAAPFGSMNERTISVIKQHYRSARNTNGDLKSLEQADLNTRENFNPYSINAFTVRSHTTPEELRRLIEYAKMYNAWIVITYHQIDRSDSMYSVTPETFEAHMKVLYDADIRSAPLGMVMDKIQEQSNSNGIYY